MKINNFWKIFLFLFLSSYFSNYVLANNGGIDSLYNKLSHSQNIARVKILNELAASLLKDSTDKALKFGTEAVSISKLIGNKEGLAESFYTLAEYFKTVAKYDSAIKYYSNAAEIFAELELISKQASSIFRSADVYENSSEYDESMEAYQKALELYESLNDKKSIGDCLNGLGVVHKYKGKYETAIDYHLKALKVFEEIQNSIGIANASGNLGNVYEALRKYDEALKYYEISLNISKEMKDNWRVGNTILNIGVIKYNKGKPEESIEDFKKSLEYFDEANDKDYMTYSLTNIGAVYQELGNYKEAIKYLNRSLQISRELNKKWSIANTLVTIAQLSFSIKNYQAVLINCDESIIISTEIGAKDLLVTNYSLLSEYYETMNDYKKSLEFHKKLKEVSDSLYNETSSKQIAEMQVKYETEKRQNEIARLKSESIEKELQIESARNLMIISIIIILIITIFAVVITKLYKSKKNLAATLLKSYKEIEELNELLILKNGALVVSQNELRMSNEEKNKFFSIIAHDIKNPFTALLISSEYLRDFFHQLDNEQRLKAVEEINKSSEQIYHLFENLLKWATSQVGKTKVEKKSLNLRELIEESIAPLEIAAINKNIEIINEVDSEQIAFVDKDMMGTVFRNLISNSIKFSEENEKIIIECTDRENDLLISVKDSGIGMREEDIAKLFRIDVAPSQIGIRSKEKGSGLGLILVKEFIVKQNGNIIVESELGKGSNFIFTVPKS